MDSFVIAIGDPKKIKNVIKDKIYAFEDDTFFIQASLKESRQLLAAFNSIDIKAYTQAQAIKNMTTDLKYFPLKDYDSNTVFDWLKTGHEYFSYISCGSFEIFSIDYKNINSINKVEPVNQVIYSNNGAVFGFIRPNIISLHVNESLDKIFDYKTTELIENALFSYDDKFIVICTESVIVFEILTSKEIGKFNKQNFNLTEKGLFLKEEGIEFIFNTSEKFQLKLGKNGRKDGWKGKSATFEDGSKQRIIYNNKGLETIKTQMNVSEVCFYSAKNRLFALIIKEIEEEKSYIIESYLQKEITVNKLEVSPKVISVSDDIFIIYDSQKNLLFFEKEKYNFRITKTYKKNGELIISVHKQMACIYDAYNENIEFYDKNTLRSVHSHKGCTNIEWSKSGLYACAYSANSEGGGQFQIFNCDGKLLYKKVFNKVGGFQWRPFLELEDSEKSKILKENALYEIKEDLEDELDVNTLLSEWKGYLISKINANCYN